MSVLKPTLLIACGALAKEVVHLIDHNDWQAFVLECLPADLHNKPKLIPDLMRSKIRAAKKSQKYRIHKDHAKRIPYTINTETKHVLLFPQ